MKLSIIINTYNRPELLENCLLSISSQSQLPDELIIADDGSTEDIISILKKYKPILNVPIKYVIQKDDGFRLARCRNNGAREASGDYIFYLDQDLVFTKDFMKTIKDNIRENYFVVGWPIRTTKEQLNEIDEYVIKNFAYQKILKKNQFYKVVKQYKKDRLYRKLNNLKLRKKGAKFRGGVAGFYKSDFIKINGFDEKYIGWGNEDDDFGRRLFYANIKGLNPFLYDYPIHLWHQEFHENGTRVNLKYHKTAAEYLNKNNFRCEFGYDNTFGNDKYKVFEI